MATTKLNASIGFHATLLLRLCSTTLRMAVAVRMSCSTMLRSEPVDASTCRSIALNLTDMTESLPHERVCTGSERCGSQICTSTPQVATSCSFQCTSSPRKACWPTIVMSGSMLSPASRSGSRCQYLTSLSSPHVHSESPSGAQATPRTKPLCAAVLHWQLPVARSQMRSSPSQLPDAMSTRRVRLRARHDTASRCPASARANGLAKTLSSLVALSARVNSRARSKGCITGSGFLNTLTTSVLRSRV